MAQTLRHLVGEIERIERMIASNAARQAAIVREIDFYRRQFGADVRRVVQEAEQVHEAEFAVVAPPLAPAAPQSAEAAA